MNGRDGLLRVSNLLNCVVASDHDGRKDWISNFMPRKCELISDHTGMTLNLTLAEYCELVGDPEDRALNVLCSQVNKALPINLRGEIGPVTTSRL